MYIYYQKEKRNEVIKYHGKYDPWAKGNIDMLLEKMDKHNIDKAVILPINDSRAYYDMR